jgi:hypothetical protein
MKEGGGGKKFMGEGVEIEKEKRVEKCGKCVGEGGGKEEEEED